MPPGWIIDKHGQPTTDPREFYDGGALLTVGAHKGSGLSIIVDLLAGALSTGRSSDPEDTVLRNNMLSIYIAPQVYDNDRRGRARGRALRRLGARIAARGRRAAGDASRRGRAHAPARAGSTQGIAIDDKTWTDILAAAASVGLSADVIAAKLES